MVACMATAVTGQAGEMTWNPETRLIAFSAGDGKPWLSAGSAQVVLTGGQVISTSDPRFKVTCTEHRESWVLTGVDEQKTLDWEMRIASVDRLSVRMDWTVFNCSTQPLKLDRLNILAGKLEGQADPAKNRVIISGNNSWTGGNVVRLVPEKKIESFYTVALQSPPLAADQSVK